VQLRKARSSSRTLRSIALTTRPALPASAAQRPGRRPRSTICLDGDLVAWITAEPCLDTMSDREGSSAFAHRIRISLPDGEVLVGCCRR
jgi:hypothetical protein